MDIDRWRRVEELYHAVLASPPGGRPALLEEQCGNDFRLREEVQSLLDARADAASFLSPEELHSHLEQRAPNAPLLADGSTFGDYRILGQLGAGGMGVVYRARDVRLDRQVALKVLPSDFARDPQWVARFRREGRAASSLNHPNIVVIHEIGQAGGTWYIASELVEGGNAARLFGLPRATDPS